MDKDEDMLTIQDAAKEFNVKVGTLRQAIKRGWIPTETRFGVKVVNRRAVQEWYSNPDRHRRGNPKYR